jgi:hypothetical protein
MEADDVVIEYLRKKLGAARGARAGKILKPPMEQPKEESLEMLPEDAAELEGLVGGDMEEDSKSGEMCAQCGAASGTCDC